MRLPGAGLRRLRLRPCPDAGRLAAGRGPAGAWQFTLLFGGSSPSFLVAVHPPQQFVDSGLAPGEAGYYTPLPLDHGVPRTPIQGMTEERLQMVRSRTPAARSLLSCFLSIRALSPPAPACGRGRCTLYSTVATAPANHLATTPAKPLSICLLSGAGVDMFRCGSAPTNGCSAPICSRSP